jgi:peptidoglycan hydrolase-like protein with peptidoglycan-binding domain
VDGVLGPLTSGAIRAFQEGRGLVPDGIVGSQTRSAIQSVATVLPAVPVLDQNNRVIRPGTSGGDVSQLQNLLKVAGYDPGPADGVYGPMTEAAVADFQEAYGSLTVDGKVGPNTREALAAYLGIGDFQSCR